MSILDKPLLTVDDFKPVDPEPLERMKAQGGDWYVYQNQAMDSQLLGHLIFLKCGDGCTHVTPPPHAPDGGHGTGWKYLLIGKIDLETGKVQPLEKKA